MEMFTKAPFPFANGLSQEWLNNSIFHKVYSEYDIETLRRFADKKCFLPDNSNYYLERNYQPDKNGDRGIFVEVPIADIVDEMFIYSFNDNKWTKPFVWYE